MKYWNYENEEEYTKEEHKASKPSVYQMKCWNLSNKDKYTEEEIKNADKNN